MTFFAGREASGPRVKVDSIRARKNATKTAKYLNIYGSKKLFSYKTRKYTSSSHFWWKKLGILWRNGFKIVVFVLREHDSQ
jgi:hypothetical protein